MKYAQAKVDKLTDRMEESLLQVKEEVRTLYYSNNSASSTSSLTLSSPSRGGISSPISESVCSPRHHDRGFVLVPYKAKSTVTVKQSAATATEATPEKCVKFDEETVSAAELCALDLNDVFDSVMSGDTNNNAEKNINNDEKKEENDSGLAAVVKIEPTDDKE